MNRSSRWLLLSTVGRGSSRIYRLDFRKIIEGARGTQSSLSVRAESFVAMQSLSCARFKFERNAITYLVRSSKNKHFNALR